MLLDVTPLSLGVETLGGVMTVLIPRNTTIPTKKSEIFSTAADNQTAVEIHVLQGERPLARDNRTLGRFQLDGIPPAPAGLPQIEVTFDIDANGILNVSAKDMATGKQQQITITASSGLSKEEVDRMVREAEANAAEDARRRQEIELRNQTDALVYSTERALAEHGAKLSEADRRTMEQALSEARETLKGEDMQRIRQAQESLRQAARVSPRRCTARRRSTEWRPHGSRPLGTRRTATSWTPSSRTPTTGSPERSVDAPRADAPDNAVGAEEVERFRHALDEEQQRSLRLLADFDNLRRRAAREQDLARRDARRVALLPLLPVLDTLERALRRRFHRPRLLRGRGRHASPLRPGASRGRGRADRARRAVRSIPTCTRLSPWCRPTPVDRGPWCARVRRGWRLGDTLLRPAQVVVVAAREAARSVAVKFRDYYEVLGVPRTATAEEIKRAYRQLARKHHPDLKPAAERAAAAERFKEINEANEVLSDPDKRAKYDALGANWKSGMDFTPPPGSGRARAGTRRVGGPRRRQRLLRLAVRARARRRADGAARGSRSRAATSRPSCR